MIVDVTGENQIAVGSGANGAAVASRLRARNVAFELNKGDVLLQQMEISKAEVFKAVAIAHEVGAFSVLNVAPSAPVPSETLAKLDFMVVNEHGPRTRSGEPHRPRRWRATKTLSQTRASTRNPERCRDAIARDRVDDGRRRDRHARRGRRGGVPAENTENAARREKRRRCPRKKQIIRVVRVADVKNVLIGDETIVDTTGAGDAFVGAFCASLAAGHALTVCLQRASVAGTLGCTKVGARAGAPRRRRNRGVAGERRRRRRLRRRRRRRNKSRVARGARRGVDQARLLLRVR